MIEATTVVRGIDGARTHELDGQAVVLDVTRNVLHLLNPTATALWARLDGTTTVEGLAAELADEFGAPREVVLNDVIRALGQMAGEGLLAQAPERSQ
jgi:hypothetical protein